MALVGDLGSVDLAQVFQVLTQSQKDGVLDVFGGDQHRGVRVRRGAITLQFDRDSYEERTFEGLQRMDRIPPEKLQLASANRHGTNDSLLDVLVKMQVITRAEVTSSFRERMAEELYELFSWSDARFEFHEGARRLEGVSGDTDEDLFFPSDGVVMEAARRLDEWGRIRERVPDEGEVYRPIVEGIAPEDDLQAAVFSSIDGARSVAEVTRRLGRSSFEVSKVVARLVDLAAIAPVPPIDYPAHGAAALAANRPRDAANLFDRAAAAHAGLPHSLRDAGRAWEAAREPATAAARFVAHGDALLETGSSREALAAYRHAHALVPTDLEAWKRTVFLSLEHDPVGPGNGDTSEARTDAHALVAVLQEIGQSTLGIEVLERVLTRHPADVVAKRALVPLVEREGSQDRLCELLESIGTALAASGDSVGAASALQRVLRLQPGRRDLSARIRDLYRKDEKRRALKRAMTVAFISSVLAGGVLLLAFAREQKARADLGAIDLEGAIQREEFETARSLLQEFRETNPFTFAGVRAGEELVRIEVLATAAAARRADVAARDRALRDRRASDAVDLARKADGSAREGRLVEALESLQKALAVAPNDWSEAAATKKNATDLESYLSGARALGQRYAEELGREDLSAARATARELLSRFGLSETARTVTLPFLVRSDPAGALIELDGEIRGTTPAVVHLGTQAKEHEIHLTLAGFSPASARLDIGSEKPIELHLGRAPEESSTLPAAASGPVAVAGEMAIVPLVGGRLAAFLDGDEPRWTATFPTQGEFRFVAVFDEARLLAVASDGFLACVDVETGQLLWSLRTPERVPVAPVASQEGFLVATEDGRVRLLEPAAGSVLREWRSGPRPSGPIALFGATLAIGGTDGSVRLLDASNPRLEERSFAIGVPVAGLAFSDPILLATGDDGRAVGYDPAKSAEVFRTSGARVARPLPIVADGRFLFDRSGRLCAVEPATGRVLATSTLGSEPQGSPLVAGDRVFVTLRDGAVLALRRDDLSTVWRWPGTGAPMTLAADREELFALGDGKLLRFRIRVGGGNPSAPAPGAPPRSPLAPPTRDGWR